VAEAIEGVSQGRELAECVNCGEEYAQSFLQPYAELGRILTDGSVQEMPVGRGFLWVKSDDSGRRPDSILAEGVILQSNLLRCRQTPESLLSH
jgi:hypothetical protein